MTTNFDRAASIPNPALKPFGALIGEWKTLGKHPLFPDATAHGRASFEWLEGGAFLIMHSEIDEPGILTGIAIIGSDESLEQCFMLYFDERGVSRKLEVTLHDNIWKWWRNAPGFSQRFTGTIVDGGNTIIGKGELSRDGSTWEKDLDLTYTRVKEGAMKDSPRGGVGRA
ncbi:MAG TPA: hypothetical protein VLZ89_13075 [Anaerolineales bacterium]|nr:hypothetical protein [Anaerolineales bacterium]